MSSAIQTMPTQLPDVPIVVGTARDLVTLTPDGEIGSVPAAAAASWLHDRTIILCNARLLGRRLSVDWLQGFDLLELFAFVHPAQPCVPTPGGLAEALGLPRPTTSAAACLTLATAAHRLLEDVADSTDRHLGPLAEGMNRGGWLWAPYVLAALGAPADGYGGSEIRRSVTIWQRLPEWEETGPPQPAGQNPVAPGEARRRLSQMVETTASGAPEPRPQQADYASAACFAFTPRQEAGEPQTVLAEAGTGVGKTFGYLAPATLWAERNGAPVWISTYTRNLQRQIDGALRRYYGDDAEAREKLVVRKGRENYLCLLNLDEALRSTVMQPVVSTALGLMVRWAAATRDGDFSGDFPFWLSDLLGRNRTLALSDRRGECIYAACDHYARCFIEHSVRRARKAQIVVANHALVMIQAATGGVDDTYRPTRYVFDEGHHVFDTADSAFSATLSGTEAGELRRWLIGAEASTRSRARGLKRRMADLAADNPTLDALLDEVVQAARCLPAEGWLNRLADAAPIGPVEEVLVLMRRQVHARASMGEAAYSLEAPVQPALPELPPAAGRAALALADLASPLARLHAELAEWLDRDAATMAEDRKRKIEAVSRSLRLRGIDTLHAWRGMLDAFGGETPPSHFDWMEIDRIEGRELDVGLHRHWIDPTIPFAAIMAENAHGLLVTSATLTDAAGEGGRDWEMAERLSGATHLPRPAIRAQVTSPFDYREITRIFVVRDVARNDPAQVAAAYRELFLASGGGALGLFTAIQRLRMVHERILAPLDAAGIPLYAQHIDGLNPTTLVDIFRHEEDSCLLGTDAIRDGVDVPGRALRLVVFDRVPWSRPSLLHKARRQAFGGTEYEDRATRLRLKQAFGRLIRRADDHGVFILLDSMLPSRLALAFPPEVPVQRVGLAEAVAETRAFLSQFPSSRRSADVPRSQSQP